MNTVQVPKTETSAMNGISSPANGDLSTQIPNHSHLRDGPELRSGTSTRSISAGMYQYTSITAFDIPSRTLISLDEIALYDRQIRLWGVRAQER